LDLSKVKTAKKVLHLVRHLVAANEEVRSEVGRSLSRSRTAISLTSLLVSLSLVLSSVASAGKPKIQIKPELQEKVEVILTSSVVLHDQMVKQDDGSVSQTVASLIVELERAISLVSKKRKRAVASQNIHSVQHLDYVLVESRRALKQSLAADFDSRQKHLQEYFKQVVSLAKSYHVKNSYKLYFCPTDRSVWIQKKGSAKNPFSPGSQCGILVN